jgi:NAD(P)-dependent dehydrogenase (short-subunit alcohol dehydrogenase family)
MNKFSLKIGKFLLLLLITNIANAASGKDYILVTGATGGLGSDIAMKFASEGRNLIIAARDKTKLATLKDKITKHHKIDVQTFVFDYNNLASLKKIEYSSIAGAVIIPPRNIFSTKMIPEASEWQAAINEGFVGPLELIRNLTGKMAPHAAMVIIAGATSKYYMPNYPNSNVIKMMWGAEIKNLCYQFAGKIRFNAISPGVILTDFNNSKLIERAKKANKTYAEQLNDETSLIPSRKYATPENVSFLVYHLLQAESDYLNCENIMLDGGMSKSY